MCLPKNGGARQFRDASIASKKWLGKGTEVRSSDAPGARGAVVQAHTESLPQVAARWRESVPKPETMPEDISIYEYVSGLPSPDLIGNTLVSGTERWADKGRDWNGAIEAQANAFVAWVTTTSQLFENADQNGAGRISSSGEPTGVRPV